MRRRERDNRGGGAAGILLLVILSGILLASARSEVAIRPQRAAERRPASSPSPPPSLPPAVPLASAFPTPLESPAPTPVPSRLPIVCEGDVVRYLEDGKVVIGEGNVRLEYKNMRLLADKVTIFLERKEAYASGRVDLYRYGNYVFTVAMRYDFLKEEGVLAPGSGFFAPWYGRADQVETSQREDSVTFYRGYATTCDLPEPHYRFEASRFIIYLDDKIVAHNAVFYVYHIPLMWVPYYQRSIKDHCQGFFLYPGFRSEWGFYLLSGYHWCAPDIQTTLHLDYRYRKGLAYGLDGHFYVADTGVGDWQTYYLKDKHYEDGYGRVKDMERYLLELWYRQQFIYGIMGYLSAHYLSDVDVRKDFFRSQYDADSQPDSYAFLGKTFPDFSLSLEAHKRLNNFYNVTEKLPEAKFQVKEISLWDTNFFYRENTSFTSFHKRYAGEEAARYQSDRFDTFHQLSYSDKYFGWLMLMPFASIRETFYSRGPGATTTGGAPVTQGSPSPEFTPTPTPAPPEEKNFWRRVFSTGIGASTSIYGIFPAEDDFLLIHKLRHVIQPSAKYVFVDQPTVTRDKIYQFDSIDKIQRANYTQLALRNLLQTKRAKHGRESSWTLLDFIMQTNLYTYPDRDNQGYLIDDLTGELKVIPFAWLGTDWVYAYDPNLGQMDKTTLDAWVREGDIWSANLEYNYARQKNKSRLCGSVFFRLSPLWAFRVYSSYNLEQSEFEEEALTVFRDLHCWDSYITFRHLDATDDYQVLLVLWIKAFGQSPLNLSN